MTNLRIVAPARFEAMVAPRLPSHCDVNWFSTAQEAVAFAEDAEVAWFDMPSVPDRLQAIKAASKLRWLNTMVVGLDELPLDELQQRGVRITNGRGLNSATIADFALMGMLSLAKGLPEIIRAQSEQRWLTGPAGVAELEGSRALIVGYGAVGTLIAQRLSPFGVDLVAVRRTPVAGESAIGPHEWRARLGDFDWIVLALPATSETQCLLGPDEFSSMKPAVRIINISRGSLIDQDELLRALESGRVSGAFLEATSPEPLPPHHPLWSAPNCIVSPHIAGRSQTSRLGRAADRFVENISLYCEGKPMVEEFELKRRY